MSIIDTNITVYPAIQYILIKQSRVAQMLNITQLLAK